TLLLADLMVWAASAILSVALVIGVARLAYHVPAPHQAGWFILSLLLGIAALFALGMLVAAAAPTARSAAGLGWLLFFPNMFFAGVSFPLEQRYESASRFIPYLLLAVPLVPYLLSQSPTAGAAGITVGIAAAAGAWVTWMVVLHPGPPRRPWQGYAYFAGLLVFIAVLTFR